MERGRPDAALPALRRGRLFLQRTMARMTKILFNIVLSDQIASRVPFLSFPFTLYEGPFLVASRCHLMSFEFQLSFIYIASVTVKLVSGPDAQQPAAARIPPL